MRDRNSKNKEGLLLKSNGRASLREKKEEENMKPGKREETGQRQRWTQQREGNAWTYEAQTTFCQRESLVCEIGRVAFLQEYQPEKHDRISKWRHAVLRIHLDRATQPCVLLVSCTKCSGHAVKSNASKTC